MSLAAASLPIPRAKSIGLSRAAQWTLIATVLLVAVLSRLSYLGYPFDGDGAMFAYMGKLVCDGGQFGTDLIDNKFPTVGLITSLFWRAFGDWWPGYVLAQLGLALLAAALLSRQAGISFGMHARLPCFLLSCTLLNLNAAVMAGFQLETIQSFFACIAAGCALSALSTGDRRDALACGMAAGMAMLVKPTGALVLVAFAAACVLTALNSPNRAQQAGLLRSAVLGAALPALCAVAYLQASGQLQLIPAIAAQIAEYARNSSFAAQDLFRPISVTALFAAAVLIRAWVYRRESHRVDAPQVPQLWMFAVGWLVLEFVGVVTQRRMYAYHFLPLAAPAALVFAAIPRRNTFGQIAGVLAPPLVLSIWGAADVIRASSDRRDNTPAVVEWLAARTLPGERVWRDITPQVLLRTDLRPASRIQLTFLFMNSDEAPLRFASTLVNDFRRTRPRYIVLPADIGAHVEFQTRSVFELYRIPKRAENFRSAWSTIADFVGANYAPAARIGDETIWERREEAGQ